MKIYSGQLSAKGKKFGIVLGRFNDFIGKQLLEGAQDCLLRHGAREQDLEVVMVPGSFEIPVAAKTLADTGRFDAVVCLGVLIRGQTPHFDYIASEVTKGIGQIGLSTGIPLTYGIITADSLEQAIERAGSKAGNKGWEAALAAIEMADLMKKIS